MDYQSDPAAAQGYAKVGGQPNQCKCNVGRAILFSVVWTGPDPADGIKKKFKKNLVWSEGQAMPPSLCVLAV